MSNYEKQNFISGQILKAEHLNHMEDGIGQLSGEIVEIRDYIVKDVYTKRNRYTENWDSIEDGYYYDRNGNKVANSDYHNYTLTAKEKPYEVYFENATGYVSISIFTSNFEKENFKAIYRTTDSNLPTESSKLTINVGEVIVICRNQATFDMYSNDSFEVTPSDNIVEDIKNSLSLDKSLNISYINDGDYEISFGKYTMKMFRTVNAENDQDNWNIGKITCNNNVVVPSGTDIVGPIKLSGDTDFLCGVHGSSTTTNINVYCDGKQVTLDSSLAKECDKITINMVDECRSQATQVHVFNRFVTIEITCNKIHISNTYVCVSDTDLLIERSTNGGLMAVRNDILTGASMNNYIITEPPVAAISNLSKNNIHAVINTIYGDIVVDNIQGHENDSYRGNFAVFLSENPIRTKIYFDVMKNETVSKGQEICGEFEYTFR